ncbi:MAG: ATP-binding protein [Candidatus Enteromonas sp.]|nr:ATP-binding protein [Candidatus Enteromonas sp.]
MCPNLWLDYSLVTNEDDRWNKRITNKDLSCEGNIFQFYRRAINALLENAPSPYCLEGVQDVGKRMVESILREAMANSITNLDLFDQSGLRINQTNKEVAFANSGTMLVPLEDALLGGTSKPRNPTLFSFFQAMGISDHGGYGIPSIFDLTKKIGFISPTLKENHSKNRTELIINFRKQTKELSKEEEMILGIINNHQDGLSPLEIVNLSPFGRDKTRKIIESLFNLGLVKDNQKPSKGKKYFPLN